MKNVSKPDAPTGAGDESPETSVVMPAYNAAGTIGEQLEALAAQAYDRPWEVIVADNESEDDTLAIVRSFATRFPRIRWASAPRPRCPANARNHGVEVARGAKILFCDADDRVAPGWVAALARALDSNDFVVGVNELRRLNPWVRTLGPFSCSGRKRELGFLPYAISSNCGMTRATFLKSGGFRTDYPRAADVEISWRLIRMGTALTVVDDALVYYRLRSRLRSILRAWMYIGMYDVRLFKDYGRFGIEPDTAATAIRRLKRQIRRMPRLFSADPQIRSTHAQRLGRSVGRLIGSLRWRCFFP